MSAGDKLKKEHKLFAEIYVSKYMCDESKASAAARDAGYKDGKGLRKTAYRLTQNANILAYIKELTATDATYQEHQEREKQKPLDINQLYRNSISYLAGVLSGEEKDTFGLDPSVRDKTAAAKELIRIKERQDTLSAKASATENPLAGSTGPFMIVPCYGAPEETNNGDAEE